MCFHARNLIAMACHLSAYTTWVHWCCRSSFRAAVSATFSKVRRINWHSLKFLASQWHSGTHWVRLKIQYLLFLFIVAAVHCLFAVAVAVAVVLVYVTRPLHPSSAGVASSLQGLRRRAGADRPAPVEVHQAAPGDPKVKRFRM